MAVLQDLDGHGQTAIGKSHGLQFWQEGSLIIVPTGTHTLNTRHFVWPNGCDASRTLSLLHTTSVIHRSSKSLCTCESELKSIQWANLIRYLSTMSPERLKVQKRTPLTQIPAIGERETAGKKYSSSLIAFTCAQHSA